MSGFEVAAIITASGTFCVSLTGMVIAIQTRREVRTYNNLTMGRKSDADEGRRIEGIAEEDRTSDEREHLESINGGNHGT